MKHVIERFKPLGGYHCITTSMKQIFKYNGIEISEEMLFGLGSGLGCFYSEFNGSPTFGARCKIGDFEENIASRLNISINLNKTVSEKRAYQSLLELIRCSIPVMVYVDMPYLKYLNMPENAHFGGHSIVVFGIDEDENTAYVSDRDSEGHKVTVSDKEEPRDFHIVSLDELRLARGSKHRPYPPENKWVTFDFSGIKAIDRDTVLSAIHINAGDMLRAPIKSVGIRGIKNFSERVLFWKDFDENKLKWNAFNMYIMASHVGGTGGGAFRKMYGNFLRESAAIADSNELEKAGDEYYLIGEQWDDVANMFYKVYETMDRSILDKISESLLNIHGKEADLLVKLKTYSEKL